MTWTQGQPKTHIAITTMSPDGKHYQAWQRGYFEARIKWDPVVGAWPGFWMIPVEDANGKAVTNGTKETGEVDILEGQGDHPTGYYTTIHRWVNSHDAGNNNDNNHVELGRDTDFTKYHVYGLLWESGRFTWYFDNKKVHSEKAFSVFDRQNYYIVLSMGVGTGWKEGNLTGVTAQKMSMTVDWVHVWQK
jgi:beta-glucanase (GH16 family)